MVDQNRSKPSPSFWLSLLFLAVILAGVITAAGWRWDTRLFPWAVGIPALMLVFWQLVADFKGHRTGTESDGDRPTEVMDIPMDRDLPEDLMRQRTLSALGWIAGFVFGIWLIGFLLAIPLFVFFYLKRKTEAGVFTALALTAGTFLFVWTIFDLLMNLAWPAPALFTLFR